MTTTTLVILGLSSVLAVLVLITKAKAHPFIALLLVAIAVALVSGVPLTEVVPLLQEGMGKTLGSVALIVALGAMLGRIVEVSGGAQVLAAALLKTFGQKRAPWALGAAAFIFGIPVFVDVATIVLVPIVFAVARRVTGRTSIIVFALPTVMALLTTHVILPPHPGIVGAATVMTSDIGLVFVIGLIPAILMWLFAQTLSGFIAKRVFVPVAPGPNTPEQLSDSDAKPPHFLTVLTLIVLPILLIMSQTVSALVLPADSPVANFLALVGASPMALLIGVILAALSLGLARGWRLGQIEDVVGSALPATAAVILITGAGGTYGHVLASTGVADAIATTLSATGLPPLVLAWLLAALIRAAQGSATVAALTTAPLVLPLATAAEYGSLQLAALTVTIGIGSMALSHVNDSLFWVWSRYFQISAKDALRSLTVTTTATSIVGLGIISLMWPLVSLLTS